MKLKHAKQMQLSAELSKRREEEIQHDKQSQLHKSQSTSSTRSKERSLEHKHASTAAAQFVSDHPKDSEAASVTPAIEKEQLAIEVKIIAKSDEAELSTIEGPESAGNVEDKLEQDEREREVRSEEDGRGDEVHVEKCATTGESDEVVEVHAQDGSNITREVTLKDTEIDPESAANRDISIEENENIQKVDEAESFEIQKSISVEKSFDVKLDVEEIVEDVSKKPTDVETTKAVDETHVATEAVPTIAIEVTQTVDDEVDQLSREVEPAVSPDLDDSSDAYTDVLEEDEPLSEILDANALDASNQRLESSSIAANIDYTKLHEDSPRNLAESLMAGSTERIIPSRLSPERDDSEEGDDISADIQPEVTTGRSIDFAIECIP